MEKNKYYGVSESNAVTFLEFGSIDLKNTKKNIWDFRLHDKAYDWLMLARYSNDMVAYLNMTNAIKHNDISRALNIYNAEMHHGDDAAINLSKLIALAIAKKENRVPSFFELGQTIFGCIEGIEFYKQLLNTLEIDFPRLETSEIDWYGVDISDFFNTLARIMHQNYQVFTFPEKSNLKKRTDVFFAKGVTMLYSCDTPQAFSEVLGMAEFGVFDYSFSLGESQETIIGTGKGVKYLSYRDCERALKDTGKSIYVKKGNSKIDTKTDRIWVDAIFGDKSLCEKFIDLDSKMRKEISTKMRSFENSSRFLNDDINPEWIKLADMVKEGTNE